jgi:hypothetical protein
MKDGSFAALQTDQIALPDIEEVLDSLTISEHARIRFRERARAGELSVGMLQGGLLSRVSPSWRAGEDYQHSLDLYLLFPFTWEDGSEDEGCLFLEREDDHYLAKTFVSRSSNDATLVAKTPPPPTSLVKKIARLTRSSEAEAVALLEKLPIAERRPTWVREQGEAWINGGSWAASLKRELVGARSPYHYSWQSVFLKHEEQKKRSRQRWAKKTLGQH